MRGLLPIAGLVALAGASTVVGPAARARGSVTPLPAASSPATVRNVVLISIDSLRADHLALYGYPRETMPVVDALAARRGATVYRRETAVSPSCHPSHTAMLTGLYPQEVGVPWCGEELIVKWSDLEQPDEVEALERYQAKLRAQPEALRLKKLTAVRNWLKIPESQETIQGLAHAAGIATGGAVSIWTLAARFGYSAGFDWFTDRMPDYYGPRSLTWLLRDTMRSQLKQSGAATIDAAIDWLRSLRAGRRFFLFLNLADAHVPYESHGDDVWSAASPDRAAMDEYWSGAYLGSRWERAKRRMSGPKGFLLDRYDNAIHYVDAQIGRLFAELAARGALDHTLVIVTSDHGDAFGQHAYLSAGQASRLFFEHSVYVWEETEHVPLLVFAPGAPAGVRFRDVNVSQVDLKPTILAALGLAGAGRGGPGRPLGELADEPRTVYFMTFGRGRPGLLSNLELGYPKYIGLRRGDLKFFVDRERLRDPGAGRCFLFDLAADPHENHDLCAAQPHRAALLRSILVEWYQRSIAGRGAVPPGVVPAARRPAH